VITDPVLEALDREIAALEARLAAEKAERERIVPNPLGFVVSNCAEALHDVDAAVRAAIEVRDRGAVGGRPMIHPSIKAACAEAAHEINPRADLAVIFHIIVRPGDVPIPRQAWRDDGRDDGIGQPLHLPTLLPDPVERAAARLARLRDPTHVRSDVPLHQEEPDDVT
jgi:hypothetical protein